MRIDAPNLNHLWAQLMIEELIRNGVTHFFVAPGSRSSPLALAVAGNKRAKMTVHFDERGIAFAALGCARATGIPAAVITTSGTAVANLFPAVVEASMDNVPMIVLTGDRPPELRDCGANQAIDQVKIFGDYTRWFFDLPCPDEKISPRFVLTTIDQAVARARGTPAGPVHLNCQFREPLAAIVEPYDRVGISAALGAWIEGTRVVTCVGENVALTSDLSALLGAKLFNKRPKKGVIVVSITQSKEQEQALVKLASALRWPLIADVRAGARLKKSPSAIRHADHILFSDKLHVSLTPDVVLQFGGRLVSKRIQQWLDSVRPDTYAVISGSLDRVDPGLSVTHHWGESPEFAAVFLNDISAWIGSTDNAWLKRWRALDRGAADAISRSIPNVPVTEPWIARNLSEKIPSSHSLVLASSMPVRDMEMYAGKDTPPVCVFSNRGASGIDGTVGTALGVALGSGEGVTLVIGDLALLHDLNSLAMVRETKKPFVIVAINNDGGAIFSFLPVAKHPEHFEKVFGTPHGLGFENAAKMFGIEYAQPTSAKDFESAYRTACACNGATLIEVRTNREENVRIHREIQDAVRKAVDRIA